MTQTEIISISASLVLGIYSIVASYKNFKLRAALQNQQNISKMWQKSSESVFMMAQKEGTNSVQAGEFAQGKVSQTASIKPGPRRDTGLVAASL